MLRSSNIVEDQFVLNDDDVFVREEAVNIDYTRNNDILITASNGSTRLVGKRGLVDSLPGKTVHGGFMLIAVADNPYFINALMGTAWYQKFLHIGVYGGNGAIGNLDKDALLERLVYAPNTPEQKAVGALFSQLDSLITLHQREEVLS